MSVAARYVTFAALMALTLVAASRPAGAQDRDRRSRDESRDAAGALSLSATTQPASAQPEGRAPALPPSPSPSSSGRPGGYGDRYGVLEQRNIFLRDRSRGSSRGGGNGGGSSSTQPTRRSAEESLVVRGIAFEDVGFRAYVEDLNTNATLRVSPGDKLARGHVTLIAPDALAYEHDGRQQWIEIGSDLTGKAAPSSSGYGASLSSGGSISTTGPTSLPANLDPNDPNLTVEQRMRIRRLQAEQQKK